MIEENSTLWQLLNVFWLRPETALWREIDIRAMSKFQFLSPSLDLGCGDGIFSFIRGGGHFPQSFDAFRDVTKIDQYYQNIDVFDTCLDGSGIAIAKPPLYQIDMGFDFKSNLLGKAQKLGLYKSLCQGNANNRLPFADCSFNSVFSNILYWLDSPQDVISEIARIMKPGARACLMVPNNTIAEFSFYNQLYSTHTQYKFLEIIDRGRFSNNIRHASSLSKWCKIFKEAGLSVDRHSRHLSKLTIQIWDIGLRPIFPILLEMANELSDEKLIFIKRKYMQIMAEFLDPLLEIDVNNPSGEEPGFHCFELSK